MFENNGHLHVYNPGTGQTSPGGRLMFHKHKYSVNVVISCKFSRSNDVLTVFHLTHRRLNLTLP